MQGKNRKQGAGRRQQEEGKEREVADKKKNKG